MTKSAYTVYHDKDDKGLGAGKEWQDTVRDFPYNFVIYTKGTDRH